MRNIIKISNQIFVVLVVSLSLFVSYPAFAQAQKIGISLPLSGNSAPLGKQFVAGARLAMKILPDANKIELIISDDGCDESLAELAIDDIKNAGAVLVTGFLCNEPVYTAVNMLHKSSIPILVTGARGNRILKDRARHSWNVWQMAPTDSDGGQAAYEILVKRWKSTPYAIVDDGTVFGRTQADEFRALMEEAGVKPQFVDNFRPSQSTQAGLIRRLSKSGVEAIYLTAGGDDVALIGRNMIEFGPGLEIATSENVSLLPYIENNKDIPVGLLAIMPPPPESILAVQKLIKVIETAKLEPEPYLLLGYATIQVVLEYLDAAENSFSGKRFQTILGPVEFDANGRNITRQYFLYRWNGKTFTKVDNLN